MSPVTAEIPYARWYSVQVLPDLNLAKYGALAESGREGVVDSFNMALRPLHRLGLCYGLRLHLVFAWHPSSAPGQRMMVCLGFSGAAEALARAPVNEVLASLPFQAYFPLGSSLVPIAVTAEPTDMPANAWLGRSWEDVQSGVQVAKVERFLSSIAARAELGDGAHAGLHVVESWQAREGSRLIGVLQLLQALNRESMVWVTLEPVDCASAVNELYESSFEVIRSYNANRFRRSLDGSTQQLPQDKRGEELLKLREDLVQSLTEQPHFQASITAWSEERHLARLLVETAVTDAVEAGSHHVHDLPSMRRPWDNLVGELPTPCHPGTPAKLQHLAHVFTMVEVGGFFRLPVLYEGEVLELPKETDAALVLSHGSNREKMSVPLGFLTDNGGRETCSVLSIPLANLTKHALIAGVPGSGKTNTLMYLAWHLWREHGIPFLVLEPAKREYRGLLNLAEPGEIGLYAPGRAFPGVPRHGNKMATGINPFSFPVGCSLAEHVTNLLACFEGAFPMFMPLPALVERAIQQVYRDRGWQTEEIHSEGAMDRSFPVMSQFLSALQKEADEASYSGEIAQNVKAALDVRFRRLNEGLTGRAFSGGDKRDRGDLVLVRPSDWLERPMIFELESLGANYSNFLTLLILTQVREALSVNPSSKLRHLLVLEEAHNLIGPSSYNEGGENADPKTAATAYVVKLLAEVRALGQAIIVADQLPSKLAPEVLKNTSLKICHRLVATDDRNQMGQTMQASAAQLEQVATLLPGQALVSFEGLQRPFLSRITLADKDLRHVDNRPTDLQILHGQGGGV